MQGPRLTTSSICKHIFPIRGILVEKVTGHQLFTYESSGTPEYCPRCMWIYGTFCIWCFNSITLGHQVTLYTPTNINLHGSNLPAYTRSPRRLMGCMQCADNPNHAAAVWTIRPTRAGTLAPYIDRINNTHMDGDKRITPVTPRRATSSSPLEQRVLITPIPMAGIAINPGYITRHPEDVVIYPS